jgi:hypothetical protein
MLLFEKKNIFSIFEPSMLLWKSLHFTKKKNPKTLMSIYSRVKRFSEKKRVLRFMLFSLLFKKKYNIMAARFFPSLRIVKKNKHEKNFLSR